MSQLRVGWCGPRETTKIICLKISINNKKYYPARAESARAVTGRRCPHSGEGEDFLSRQPDFFTETAVNREWKVEKIDPKVGNEPSLRGLQMGHRPKLGSYGKIGFFGQKPKFWAQKKDSLLEVHHVLATPGKKLFKEKSCLCPNNY